LLCQCRRLRRRLLFCKYGGAGVALLIGVVPELDVAGSFISSARSASWFHDAEKISVRLGEEFRPALALAGPQAVNIHDISFILYSVRMLQSFSTAPPCRWACPRVNLCLIISHYARRPVLVQVFVASATLSPLSEVSSDSGTARRCRSVLYITAGLKPSFIFQGRTGR
jgi:hypothetical protein